MNKLKSHITAAEREEGKKIRALEAAVKSYEKCSELRKDKKGYACGIDCSKLCSIVLENYCFKYYQSCSIYKNRNKTRNYLP